MAIDGVSGTSATSGLDTSRRTIAGNFDTFLSILTTQLKNQNPLDPLDTNQFTAQLVQFTGVEQQLKTNEFLETLMLSSQNTAKSDAVSYIGKQVTASGKTGELTDDSAVFWSYNAASNVANAAVTIKNAQGQVVYTEMGSLNAGPGTFRWDGMGSDGNVQPNGIYTIEITGTNLAGKPVEVSTSSVGIVTGVDFTGSVPVLQVGRSKVAITDVTDVRIPEVVTPPVEDDGGEDEEA
ncbi:flagellar hook assembly protein FlgD [Devosia albogilva]|uniref:Basal-body rod modification protein FlgD n=1 Tax=Devosia albogilva TaxID=429726 RepID=A0ABW5QHY0_9HYPH